MNKKISLIELKRISLVMGSAVRGLGELKALEINSPISMLGFGFAARPFASFQE